MINRNNSVIELRGALINKKCIHYTQNYEIPKLDGTTSYHAFFEEFLFSNQPCVVKGSFILTWLSYKEWVLTGKPNILYLGEKYGSIEVPVADCGEKYYNVQRKSTSQLHDFLNYWSDYIKQDCPNSMPCLYMKDWHFTRDFPTEEVYRVPQYFASDWLNEFFSSKTDIVDDYRFVYMGPKGSWTPLHADVFMSFSWSANICGRKRWLLFPPGQESFLYDKYGNLAYDATAAEMLDLQMFPNYHKLSNSYEVIQEPGEIIFVPSGWHHQVWNLEDTISINHNWVNGCNIEAMWKSLKSNLVDVKREVEDCKEMEEWEEHCQLMLRATYGIDYEEFYTFLTFIARRRLDCVVGNKQLVLFGDWHMGKEHSMFDLAQLKKVLDLLLSDPDTMTLKFYQNILSEHIILEIDTVLLNLTDSDTCI